MATRQHNTTGGEEDDNRGTTTSSSSRGGRSRKSGGSRTGGGTTAGLSAATILDIVERLGVIDMIVDRMKARVDEVDADQLIDDIADYLRKNPEVLVVALGAVTIASGALVYLNRRK
ncbi:MAG TPA: hypothetical protein VLU46_16740 [Thermoanaerobaculia bacterium]|nr:hypothetical protein [Thermoanaerobaculia bacterium]